MPIKFCFGSVAAMADHFDKLAEERRTQANRVIPGVPLPKAKKENLLTEAVIYEQCAMVVRQSDLADGFFVNDDGIVDAAVKLRSLAEEAEAHASSVAKQYLVISEELFGTVARLEALRP